MAAAANVSPAKAAAISPSSLKDSLNAQMQQNSAALTADPVLGGAVPTVTSVSAITAKPKTEADAAAEKASGKEAGGQGDAGKAATPSKGGGKGKGAAVVAGGAGGGSESQILNSKTGILKLHMGERGGG